jgi:microcompartment protein CcmL/EutN
MTAYVLIKWSQKGDYDEVLAAMETQLETVTNSKTIYLCSIIPRGNEFVGVLLYAE